ncbi:amidase [Enterovirga rhinocerotis]|uniref:Aspartyl-tRNA(Asn)/glutamyl-tRNA(Gln) amidotransferase subunit A n=1 Tax=Enterovirga rhinocerotis TaxID=1339210 RepID=A0A4R7BXU9_9HYPH|nr:amidase [Enterovirga rhinocerotis]TDR89027.1 aspartyl-tRNA(Asn)/glutamyl-tRNA(Gln) amidotransferase subunit A [Enterovirga rhinocerotis]
MTDLLSLDTAALAEGYRSKRFSPVEVVEAALTRAEAVNPAVNAFTLIDREAGREAAKASEARWSAGTPVGPLDGMPFTVKDNVLWKDRPARRGSRSVGDAPAAENAPSVDRLIEAGAVPFAKTTLPEFGWKGLGDSPLTGLTRNPWDTRMTTGGSSAGAAAAAALGIGPLHIGTDGAGSIRIPAAFCGIFGHKPSYSRVPAYPPSPFGIVSHLGPMSRSVTDAAAMLSAVARPDPRDIDSLWTEPQDYTLNLDEGVRGLRFAWSPRLGYADGLDPEVEALCADATRAFSESGGVLEDADPAFSDPTDILRVLWRTGAWLVLRDIPEERWSELDPGFVAEGQEGSKLAGADFVRAANARAANYTAAARFHQSHDLLLTPTLSIPAFEVGHNTPPDGRYGDDWLNWTPYSYPFDLTLQPAATVPCGLTKSGLPVGLQIVGAMGRDDLVLRAARAFEKARPWATIDESRVRH